MRERLQNLGRVKLVGAITLAAVVLAVLANLFISWLFDFQTTWFEDVFRAAVIPIFWHLYCLGI